MPRRILRWAEAATREGRSRERQASGLRSWIPPVRDVPVTHSYPKGDTCDPVFIDGKPSAVDACSGTVCAVFPSECKRSAGIHADDIACDDVVDPGAGNEFVPCGKITGSVSDGFSHVSLHDRFSADHYVPDLLTLHSASPVIAAMNCFERYWSSSAVWMFLKILNHSWISMSSGTMPQRSYMRRLMSSLRVCSAVAMPFMAMIGNAFSLRMSMKVCCIPAIFSLMVCRRANSRSTAGHDVSRSVKQGEAIASPAVASGVSLFLSAP